MKKRPNYPLYETTIFPDFRIMVDNAAEKFGDRTAISYREKPTDENIIKVSYNECRTDVRNLGSAFIELGCRRANYAIIGGSCYGWVISYFALMASGSVTVPADSKMPASDLIGIINRAGCEAVLYTSNIEDKIVEIKENCPTVKHFICMKGAPADGDTAINDLISRGAELIAAGDTSYDDYDLDPDKLASIVFTSGTTGRGKGVMLSQTNIVSDMTQGMYNFAITPKTLAVLPLHHTFGSTVNIVGHYAQGSEIYISSGIKYFAKEMKEQQPSHLILVPLFVETLYKKIWATAEQTGRAGTLRKTIKLSNGLRKIGIDHRKTLFSSILSMFGGKLQMVICGGASINDDIIDFFDALGITILNGYGITECAPLISCNRNEYQKRYSVGTPIIGELVKIANPDENGEGEICVKGPNVMLGYYLDDEATAAAFDEEGYFKTGDYGKIDSDGWIYITGRLKNLIIFSNGKNVYPEEIESEISRIYGVAEAVVYAGESKSNPEREVIVAEIYPDYDALKAHNIDDAQKYFNDEMKKVNERMASYKKVGYVKLRDVEFIKNTSEKITRFNIDKTIE